jgi:site-specific recombinase XerD
VDQLFHDWYRTDLSRRLKHPKIPYRVYTKDISPVIGIKCIAEVTARDVREVLERIRESNRPTIANDTLMYMKQLFRHAIKLNLTLSNPAAAFTPIRQNRAFCLPSSPEQMGNVISHQINLALLHHLCRPENDEWITQELMA